MSALLLLLLLAFLGSWGCCEAAAALEHLRRGRLQYGDDVFDVTDSAITSALDLVRELTKQRIASGGHNESPARTSSQLFVGCYSLESMTVESDGGAMTTSACVTLCSNSFYSLAGVLGGGAACYCSNDGLKHEWRAAGELCSSPCVATQQGRCGGAQHLSVFQTPREAVQATPNVGPVVVVEEDFLTEMISRQISKAVIVDGIKALSELEGKHGELEGKHDSDHHGFAYAASHSLSSLETGQKFLLLALGRTEEGGSRCADSFGLRYPIEEEQFLHGAGPWSCDVWHFDSKRHLVTGRGDMICLSVDHLGRVKGRVCATMTLGGLHGACSFCDEWVAPAELSDTGVGSALHVKDAPEFCLESIAPCMLPLVSHIGEMRACRRSSEHKYTDTSTGGLSRMQRWLRWSAEDSELLLGSRSNPHDCTIEDTVATSKLMHLSANLPDAVWTLESNKLRMDPHVHRSFFRNFADVYEATPISYLTNLARAHRNSEQGAAFQRLFKVRQKFANISQAPRNVISWALFVPREAPAGQEHIYGSPSREEVGYVEKHAKSPRTLEEATSGTQYSGTSFFAKYVEPMQRTHAMVNHHFAPRWSVRLHLDPQLEWLVPTFLSLGNVEVHVMAMGSIRTLGAMWRWIPFDDTTLHSVLALDADDNITAFQNWPAVESWRRSPLGYVRWYHGWLQGVVRENSAIMYPDGCDQVVEPPYFACHQYASMQGRCVIR